MAKFLNPTPDFWRGKRVFLTGHTGFKGTWLANWLERLGTQTLGFALAPDTNPSLCELVRLEQRIETVRGDIRDAPALSQAMTRFAPDIVLHLAAQSLVQRSYKDPALTFETNVMGTVNLLEAVRATPSVRAVVIVTSDKCYENREWIWAYREDEALGGHDPYSASKACAELVTSAWRRSFFGAAQADGGAVAVASARAGNVIGGGDWAADRLIPDCMRAFAAGKRAVIRNPRATRPWQHVLEPLSGYLLLAERLWRDGMRAAEAWNFGPAVADVQPVSHIADAIARQWGEGAGWETVAGDFPHEAGLLAVDATKARARLDWTPRLRLADALSWTTDWYRQHHRGASADRLVDEQIVGYENLARAP